MPHKNWLSLLFAAVLVTAAAGTTAAQLPPPPDRGQNAPGNEGGSMQGRPMEGDEEGPMSGPRMEDGMPGEAMEVLGFGEAPGEGVVKSAPYSAKALTEKTHVLGDGNRIHRTTEAAVYRDGEGRFRREFTLPAGGPMNDSGKPRSLIVIRDPEAGTGFLLVPERKIARKLPARMQGRGAENRERFQEMRKKMEASGEVKSESLGTKTINGVAAEGKRITRVIPAGKIGNEKTIEITNEVWYSKELHAVVLLKRNDPRNGSTTYQLTDIQRKEPDPKLFQVPSDYKIREGMDGRRGRFGGRGQRGGMGGRRGPRGGGQQQPPDQDY
jgi:hypothetical protein